MKNNGRNEQRDSEMTMMEFVVKRQNQNDQRAKQSNEESTNKPTNQPWFEMITFKTEQKHENQKENKKITEIDEKQKKIDGNDWNRWVSRIHKKTQ